MMIDMHFDDENEEYFQMGDSFRNELIANYHNTKDTLRFKLIEPDYISTLRQLIEAYQEEKQLRGLLGEYYDDRCVT